MDQSFCYLLCGDGYVDQEDNYAETCDDSNYLANDGCNASCQTEEGWICPAGEKCKEICKDGLLVGVEKCDSGEELGCNEFCTGPDPEYQCTNSD